MAGYYHAGVLHQRMRPFGAGPVGPPPPPPQVPFVGVVAPGGTHVEGGTITMTINRTVVLNGAVTYTYTFVSEGGAADFAESPTGTRTISAGQAFDAVSVRTVQRTGTQGSRTVTCVLSNVIDGLIDLVHQQASVELVDFTSPPAGQWHKLLPYRSGHPWARGPSYFNDWTIYEDNCGYIDAFNGSNYGTNKERVATWELMAGGPKGNPNSILSGGQLSWTNNNRFPTPWKEHVVNRSWCCFTCSSIPLTANTEVSTAAHNRVWTDINAGIYDQYYKDMGGRIKINCEARGVSMQWMLLRWNHENEQSNFYRVYSDSKLNYKSAMERTHDLVREGADFPLKMMFCPGPNKNYSNGTGTLGTLGSWCPDNADAISMSFHPNGNADDKNGYLQKINGNSLYWGLHSDVIPLARDRGMKIAFGEWSPVVETCPIADDIYRWFYDETLLPNRDILVFDGVFDQVTFDKQGAADAGQGATGAANWSEGVDVFKARWKGRSASQPGYVNPDWPSDTVIPPFLPGTTMLWDGETVTWDGEPVTWS